MTTGEMVKILINTKDYTLVRKEVSNEFIELVREMLPRDYEYFQEKEEEYQRMVKLLNENGIFN